MGTRSRYLPKNLRIAKLGANSGMIDTRVVYAWLMPRGLISPLDRPPTTAYG